MFYLIEIVQTHYSTVSTKFNMNERTYIDIKMFYLIELVQKHYSTVSTKFNINE